MEEIKDYAILLIYPDGEVEKIPITTFKNHMDYLSQHFQKSKKFKKFAYGINWEDDMHYNVSKILAMHGVIEISNQDMYIKIKNAGYYKKINPKFYFWYPSYLESQEQLNALERIEKRIPKEQQIYNEFISVIFNFAERTYVEYEGWKEGNKNRFESEIHTL